MSNYFSQATPLAETYNDQYDFPAVTKEDIVNNWTNSKWSGWHSPDWEEKGRPVRDDAYLRSTILKHLQTTNRTSIPIPEIIQNWTNPTWWQDNIGSVIYIMDNMYVKKSVKAYNGIYSNWLTRLVQFCNTYIAERGIKGAFGFTWNEADHTNIHSGIATAEENKPDFIAQNRLTVELKVVENESSIVNFYFKNLKENFEATKRDDFHDADYAMFCTKSNPSNLYTVKLDSPDSLNLDDLQVINLDLIPTNNGKLEGRENNPAVPLCLLYGLTPRWQKKVN